MALAMLGLFAVTPPIAPPCLVRADADRAVFSAFSFLTINFYAQGVLKADALGENGHVRLAAWRETGALIGVCLAAVAPTVLVMGSDTPFALFALGFAGVAALAVVAMRGEWAAGTAPQGAGFRGVLADPLARRLLLIALVNATPVAVTSTLFLFFVESRLQAPGMEGPLLLLFFLSAAASAPFWGRARTELRQEAGAARWHGALHRRLRIRGDARARRHRHLCGDLPCLGRGARGRSDLLPRSSRPGWQVSPSAAEAFGLWSFVTKFTLAISAVLLLPALEAAGFRAGGDNPPAALGMLTVLYALVPCALKLIAIALLAITDLKES
jgi:glycoside/pentoside/hexuronide:cation symporter, GPH family